MRAKTRVMIVFSLLLPAILLLASTQPATSQPAPVQQPLARDLSEYRAKYPTKLTRHGPPPEIWQDPTPLKRPPGVDEIMCRHNPGNKDRLYPYQ